MGRGPGVPVLGVDDQGARVPGGGDQAVDGGDDVLPVVDVQAAARVGEVVLHIDDEECAALIEAEVAGVDHVGYASLPSRWAPISLAS